MTTRSPMGSIVYETGGLLIDGGWLRVPDTLEWETLDRGYSDFLFWALSADLASFYEAHRWPGWPADVEALAGDQAFSIYPPLWTKGPPTGERSRSAVPMAVLFDVHFDIRGQLHE